MFKFSLYTGGVFFIIGLVWGVFGNAVDREQGQIFKLLYLHVPASWWSLTFYALMGGCGLLGFITKIPQLHLMAKYLSVPGLILTSISLITGMIWGYVTWGTFWVWDARLTTMFIQFLIYLGYVFMVFQPSHHIDQHLRTGSFLILLGLINLPLIKWSVNWWFTLHQPESISLLRMKNTIHQEFLPPLVLTVMGTFFLSIAIFARGLYTALSKNQKRKL